MPRTIIHIAIAPYQHKPKYMGDDYDPGYIVAATCSDGTSWVITNREREWDSLPDITTDEEEEAILDAALARIEAEHADVTRLPLTDCMCAECAMAREGRFEEIKEDRARRLAQNEPSPESNDA